MYQIEAYKKNENIRLEFIKQFKLMSWRLWYIITWPSAILASFFGVLLIVINQSLLNQNWMICLLNCENFENENVTECEIECLSEMKIESSFCPCQVSLII